jgi:acyl-CoA synthetase (AMP-forming)/AMP-acid ligase II/acyl carrier protein
MPIAAFQHVAEGALSDVTQPFSDILTLLRARAKSQPDAIAILHFDDHARSYAALLKRVETLAMHLITGRTDRPRFAIVMPNGGAFSETLLAVTVVGVALPFNPSYTLFEFESYFVQTEVDFLVTMSGFAPVARQTADRLGLHIIDVDVLSPDAPTVALSPPAPNDVAMVLLTSGSTGHAKRVPLTHSNVCTGARDVSISLHLTPEDRCLSMWELFHVGGLVDLLLAPLHSGGTVIATPGFDARMFFDLMVQRKPTWYQAVPTALAELALVAPRVGYVADGASDLRFVRSVAAALSPNLMAEIKSLFHVPVLTTFGMTEASPLITSTDFDAAEQVEGSVGRSCGTDIGIFDGHWQRQGIDVEGEVAIRGANVFSGYEADTLTNATAFRDGWFRTGDLGRIDQQGRLFLTGRIKELVNRGGEKVNLREVDDAILLQPGVFQAAAFPVPHRTLGEDVAAAVVLRQGVAVSETELRNGVATILAPFKVPRQIIFVQTLPKNAVGKIDRRQLAADALMKAREHAYQENKAQTSELESLIAAIWARELGLPSVATLDDFNALGGDSLASLRVLLAVEAGTGLVLPNDTASQLSTVHAMAKLLVSKGRERNSMTGTVVDSVTETELRVIQAVVAMGEVPVNREGSLFKVANPEAKLVPLIWFFNRPAKEMTALSESFPTNRPLYGGFSGGKIFDMSEFTMERLAKLYVAELEVLFPEGDFILGGNCKGARMAWEVARQLKQKGRIIKKLCLLEFADPNLTNFDSPILLMFGKHSRRKAYKAIGWGKEGWDNAFTAPIIATWVDGTHGEFFRGEETNSIVNTITAFLDETLSLEGTLADYKGRRIMNIHRNLIAFGVYLTGYKLRSWLRNSR